MLKIVVCDAQLIFLNEAKAILKQSPYVTSVETYNEPEVFMQAVLQEKDRFDVVLLDIHF